MALVCLVRRLVPSSPLIRARGELGNRLELLY